MKHSKLLTMAAVVIALSSEPHNVLADNLTFAPDDVFVAEVGHIRWFHSNGTFNRRILGPAFAHINFGALTFDSEGHLFALSRNYHGTVHRFNQYGVWSGLFLSGFDNTNDITYRDGNLYIAGGDGELNFGRIHVTDSLGNSRGYYDVDRAQGILSMTFVDSCKLWYVTRVVNKHIFGYDLCKNESLGRITAKSLPNTPYSIRKLSSQPGSDVIVGMFENIARLNSSGRIIKIYENPNPNPDRTISRWFGMAANKSGTEFWGTDRWHASLFRFNVSTGNFTSYSDPPLGWMYSSLFLAVFGGAQ